MTPVERYLTRLLATAFATRLVAAADADAASTACGLIEASMSRSASGGTVLTNAGKHTFSEALSDRSAARLPSACQICPG